jgi:hypothetical protein
MKTLAGVAAIAMGLLTGCQAGDDDYVTVPPGNGPPGEPNVQDAAPDGRPDGGDDDSVTSQVCILTDIRISTVCPATAADITVRELGTGNVATTRADGTFTLPVTGTGVVTLQIGFGDGNLYPSVIPVTVGQVPTRLPVVRGSSYRTLQSRLGGDESDVAGDVVVYYTNRANLPLVGVTADTEGMPGPPFYDDDDDANLWSAGGGTGTFGAALLLGVPIGVARVVATDGDGVDLTLTSVPVEAGHLTFATARAD